ncbi:MAG: transcriptional repressor LexA [Gammaproteobacteria bacterium]|nr:transcriptional repressor LexA [Gammaproteobacteria bacterium]
MLTPAQQKTLDFIRRYWRLQGRSPSLMEIAAGIGIRSRGVVHRYVQALIAAGHVRRLPGRKRGLELTEQDSAQTYTLPLLGRIAAGRPIEAIPGEGTLDMTAFLLGLNRYALRVYGDSMIEAGILDGDTVIVDARGDAGEGAIVVALIDEQEATLKRLHRRKDGSIQLTAANAALAPMIYSAERVRVQGVVVGVLRSYR